MIVCFQPFLNELDLLEVKMETLGDAVDLWVVVESGLTFTGINKPLLFKENQGRFSKFPVHYVQLEDPLVDVGPWEREIWQRNAATKAIRAIDARYAERPKLVLWTDSDEVIKPEAIDKFKAEKVPFANMELDMLEYYFNWAHPKKWPFPRISWFRGQEPSRGDFTVPTLKDCGWHFEYCGGKERLLEKVNATSHASGLGTRDFWQRVRKGVLPSCEILKPYPEERLPKFIQDNRERFAGYFSPVPPPARV